MAGRVRLEELRQQETPGERPKRLSLSEILVLLLERGSPEHSSVRLTRNAKGDTQIEVVIRSGGADADTIEQAAAKTREIYDDLRQTYPLSDGS